MKTKLILKNNCIDVSLELEKFEDGSILLSLAPALLDHVDGERRAIGAIKKDDIPDLIQFLEFELKKTAHDLARELLKLPNVPVIISGWTGSKPMAIIANRAAYEEETIIIVEAKP